MIWNYFITAFRNMIRRKEYTLINIAGLAVGMTCCLLIFVWVQHEIGYDRFHRKAGRIYRVAEYTSYDNGFVRYRVSAGAPLAEAILNEYPAVEAAVRFYRLDGVIKSQNVCSREKDLFFTDGDVFKIFSFDLKRGDPETALKEPNTAVISEKLAVRYFGDTDPMGQVLKLENRNPVRITGILKEIPTNSHLQFDFLASFETLLSLYPGLRENWEAGVWTYVLLQKGYASQKLERQLPVLIEKYRGKEQVSAIKLYLQPLKDIHLYSNYGGEIESKTNVSTLITFSLIGLFILVMAGINFINLSTASAVKRAREVGLRKVVGANRLNLIIQFLSEVIVISVVALVVALALMELLLPVVNSVLQKELSQTFFHNITFWLVIAGGTVFIGVLAGIYPAFYMSMFNPSRVLSGLTSGSPQSALLRKILVVVQYAISIALIIGTIIGYSQWNFLLHKELGFDRQNLLVIPMQDFTLKQHYQQIKTVFLQNSGVVGITGSSQIPGGQDCNGLAFGSLNMEELENIPVFFVDDNFTTTLGLTVLEGHDFEHKQFDNNIGSFIINESALKELGDIPIGSLVQSFSGSPEQYQLWQEGTVIGLVKDYHFRNLFYRLQPQVLIAAPKYCDYMLIRLNPENIQSTLSSLKSQWTAILPDQPFVFSFLDDELDRMYQAEKQLSVLLNYFCLLAIFIAVIGLYGLATAVTELRTREMGIRKVLGASVFGLVFLISREFLFLILIANVIAWPTAYYFMNRWLNGYFYRIGPGLEIYFLAAILAIVISFLTIGYRAVKTALSDPVKALRHE